VVNKGLRPDGICKSGRERGYTEKKKRSLCIADVEDHAKW
jgi:hypothetical protein